MEIYIKMSLICTFSVFFLVFNHDFVIYIDFIHVAASKQWFSTYQQLQHGSARGGRQTNVKMRRSSKSRRSATANSRRNHNNDDDDDIWNTQSSLSSTVNNTHIFARLLTTAVCFHRAPLYQGTGAAIAARVERYQQS